MGQPQSDPRGGRRRRCAKAELHGHGCIRGPSLQCHLGSGVEHHLGKMGVVSSNLTGGSQHKDDRDKDTE